MSVFFRRQNILSATCQLKQAEWAPATWTGAADLCSPSNNVGLQFIDRLCRRHLSASVDSQTAGFDSLTSLLLVMPRQNAAALMLRAVHTSRFFGDKIGPTKMLSVTCRADKSALTVAAFPKTTAKTTCRVLSTNCRPTFTCRPTSRFDFFADNWASMNSAVVSICCEY